MAPRFLLNISATALLAVGVVPVFAADSPAAGNLWKVTSKMSMEGMPMEMPAQTSQVCAPKVWTKPPTNPNDRMRCTNTNFKLSGMKATWDVACKGPPAMQGTGEMIWQSEDAYTGTIRYSGNEGGMTIKLSGQRMGTCDNPS